MKRTKFLDKNPLIISFLVREMNSWHCTCCKRDTIADTRIIRLWRKQNFLGVLFDLYELLAEFTKIYLYAVTKKAI